MRWDRSQIVGTGASAKFVGLLAINLAVGDTVTLVSGPPFHAYPCWAAVVREPGQQRDGLWGVRVKVVDAVHPYDNFSVAITCLEGFEDCQPGPAEMHREVST